jgi:hypothetical protein
MRINFSCAGLDISYFIQPSNNFKLDLLNAMMLATFYLFFACQQQNQYHPEYNITTKKTIVLLFLIHNRMIVISPILFKITTSQLFSYATSLVFFVVYFYAIKWIIINVYSSKYGVVIKCVGLILAFPYTKYFGNSKYHQCCTWSLCCNVNLNNLKFGII